MNTKDWAELQESLLAEQLKVVRKFLKKDKGAKSTQEESPLSEGKGRSKIGIVEDILREVSKPLHVSEIIQKAKTDHQTVIDKESIVSAITKKLNKGDTFIRVAPNTFALKKKVQGD
jgi:predicted transcriptional regulator